METEHALNVADGTTLHYRLWRGDGKRPLLVLLHGMASNRTRWSEFVEHTNLKQHFNILWVDLRGHGESFTRRRIGMEIWSDDLAAILDAQGAERAVFIGHSLGANLALWFAHRYPTRVAALGLIDPTFTAALRGNALWIYRLSPVVRMLIAVLRLLNFFGIYRRKIPNRDLRVLDENMRTRLLNTGREEDFVKRYTSPLADLKHFSTANYLQEFIEITRPIPGVDELRVPVLALISKAVTFTDIETTRAALLRCPQVQITMLTAHHWPLTEKPAEVRGALEDWAKRIT